MGWICPSCGSENSFGTEVCRACCHKVHPVHLAGERLATVRDRLQANRFDFLGRSLEERSWDQIGQAGGVWHGILPYVLVIMSVITVLILLLQGMPGLFGTFTRWQEFVAEAPQVILNRGASAREHLLYDWRPEEERVQAAADGLHTLTQSAVARTEELAQRAEKGRSSAGENVSALKSRLLTEFHLGRITDRVKESGALALGGRQSVERRAETREQAAERVTQYQETFTQRVQELTEKVKSKLQFLGDEP